MVTLTSLAEAQWAGGDRGAARAALFGGARGRRHRANPALFASLETDRELSILRALTGKATQREIGAALFLR